MTDSYQSFRRSTGFEIWKLPVITAITQQEWSINFLHPFDHKSKIPTAVILE